MSNPSGLDPRTVSRMLGSAAARGGALNLLSLEPDTCTESRIEAALQRQLDRIGQHADGESRAADALRVALHEAASGLLNPARRAAEIARYLDIAAAASPPGAAIAPVTHDPRSSNPPRTRQRSGDPLIARLLVIIGAALVAMVGLVVVIAMIFTSSPTSPSTSVAATPADTSAAPVTAAANPASEPAPQASVPSDAAPPADALATPATGPARERTEFADAALVIRELRAASELVRSEPDAALKRFEAAFLSAGDWWCRFDPAQVRAASDSVVEFVYRTASRPDHASRALAVITAPSDSLRPREHPMTADEVWPAAWSVGVISRLHRERDLPAPLAASIARAFDGVAAASRPRSAADIGFDSGVSAAFAVAPVAIFAGKGRSAGSSPDDAVAQLTAAAMARWIEGVSLWYAADPDARERVLTDALGWVMTSCQEPEADDRVFRAISTLATEIKWRVGGVARPSLVGWFREPRVSPGDLRVLTAALATRSGAEGVDATMVLPMTARTDDRERLRTVYAQAWGLAEASARIDATKRWVTAARAALAASAKPDDPLDQLSLAAALSRVSTGASLLWNGSPLPDDPLFVPPASSADPDALARSLGPNVYYVTIGGPAAAGGGGSATGSAADGAWASRYLAAERNIPVRLERLKELDHGGPPIGPIDAGLLAEAACFASPAPVRLEAQRVVISFANQPAMVAAMLDILAIAPRSHPLSEALAHLAGTVLPRPTDPDWELLARRALVERLLGMLASTGIHGDIESRAAAIAGAYLAMTGQQLSSETSDAAADGAIMGAAAHCEGLRREAGVKPVTRAVRFNLDVIDRRLAERRAQAIGPVQAFVAEQAGIADLLAFLVATERPASEPLAADVLDELVVARRRSKHVFGQALANEQALIKLWLIRFGETPTP